MGIAHARRWVHISPAAVLHRVLPGAWVGERAGQRSLHIGGGGGKDRCRGGHYEEWESPPKSEKERNDRL